LEFSDSGEFVKLKKAYESWTLDPLSIMSVTCSAFSQLKVHKNFISIANIAESILVTYCCAINRKWESLPQSNSRKHTFAFFKAQNPKLKMLDALTVVSILSE